MKLENFTLLLLSYVYAFTFSLDGGSNFRRIGAGGAAFSTDPFSTNSNNPRKFFNVARVRGGSKDSRKLIKLFELVKEQRKIEQKKIDQENITRIQAALPKQFKFQIVQHISDKQRFIGRFGDDYYALFFPEPRDLVDKDFVSLDERLISNGGSFEYFSNNLAFDTAVSGKRTIRVVKVLREDEMNQRINVPELIDQIDELTKEEFLRVLKSGENFNVTMLDEVVCGSCVGGYRVIKTSSLQRDRIRCRVCSAKGKVLKEVDFSIIWDLSLIDVEGRE